MTLAQGLSWGILALCFLKAVVGAQFGCTTTSQTDDFRNVALEAHKQYRKLMAKGEAPNKCGTLPTAKNYYEIQWDCNLEKSAFDWSSACNYAYSSNSSISELVYRTTSASPSAAFMTTFMYNLNLVPQFGADATMSYNSNLRDWNKIANSKILYFGCGSVNCGSFYLTTCHYDKPTYSNEKLYTVGDNCVVDADCNAILGSTCNDGICKAPPKGDETLNTQCPTNTQMNDYARDQVLQWHNYYRSLVIKGNEPAGGSPAGRKAPKGRNMYKLSWSCELEYNAQKWADTCPFPTHSNSSTRVGWGENMARMTASGVAADSAKSVQLYYSELPDYGMVDLVTNKFTYPQDMTAGHYTQVVWGKTYEVGCGIKLCSGQHHTVCQYNVAGNYIDNIVYDVQTTGDGGCKTDADCTTQAADTCSVSDGLCIRA